MAKGYIAFVLDEKDRTKLLEQFSPKYEKMIAHHITHQFGVSDDAGLPELNKTAVVGYADSGDGIEALVVEVNASIRRPDRGIYHITLSLDPSKYKPKDSNTLVGKGWKMVNRIEINPTAKFISF